MNLRKIIRSPVLLVTVIITLACLLHAAARRAASRPNDSGKGIQVLVFLEKLEALTYDARVKLRASFTEPGLLATNMATIFFDDLAVEQVNDGSLTPFYAPAENPERAKELYPRFWPWPRFIYGQIVRELSAEGAKAVGFDIMFPEKAQKRDEENVPTPEGDLTSDEFFASAMANAGNVYLAVQTEDTVPIPLFATNAAGLASIVSHTDYSILRRVRPFDIVRVWHPLLLAKVKPLEIYLPQAVKSGNKMIIPRRPRAAETEPVVLPLNANGTMKMTGDGDIDFSGDSAEEGSQTEFPFVEKRVWNLGITLAAKALDLDLDNAKILKDRLILSGPNGLTRTIPLDSAGFFYIDWSIQLEDLRTHRIPILFAHLEPILANDKFRSSGGQTNIDEFKNRIVLIGSIASGNNMTDFGGTPLESQAPLVTKHLNIANSLLTGRFIQRSNLWTEMLLIALMGLAATALALNVRAVAASVAALLLALAYVAGAVALYRDHGYWIPIVTPVACSLAATHLCILIERSDPMAVARRFFARAGFRRVESLSPALLVLHPKQAQTDGLAALWKGEESAGLLTASLRSVRKRLGEEFKLYLIYQGQGPSSSIIQCWRQQLGCEIVPIPGAMLETALREQNCERQLKQLEEPYLIRNDPYAEFKPIADPTWFYGRNDLIERLPASLAQGQHVAIFGLRKVGKTSLTNQLRQRFLVTPCAFVDCQGLPAKAESYFDAIYQELHFGLRTQGIGRLPKAHRIVDSEDFSRSVLELFGRWEASGHREPFVIFFDEIDKFLSNPGIEGRDEMLVEYVRLFRVIRALAQSRQCLVTCVVAYRPAVNRQNILSAKAGENPMFNSFQEVYLGFLNEADSEAMVREIGLWKNIVWEEKAARKVFDFCGGHPLITRYFASQACRRGTLKEINEARVLETADEIEKTLRKNEIGNYYKEAIGDLLLPEEQQVLKWISQNGESGVAESDLESELEEALSNLENFGLVENSNGRLRLSAEFFRVWLARRHKA